MVSFIVPLYNCLRYTQETVAGLQRSLPQGLEHEIILVDDCSTDGTREWLATLESPFQVLLNDRNLGYGASNNRGAGIALGETLVLLNNDLVLAPGWLEPLLSVHKSLGDTAGVVGNVQLSATTGGVDHAGIFFNLKGKPEHDKRIKKGERMKRVDAVTGACLLIDADVWKRLGGFDAGYVNGCEDVDLCLRARSAGLVNAVALGSVIGHHISSSTGRKLRDEQNTLRLVQRWRADIITLASRTWCQDCVHAWLHERGRCPEIKSVVLAGLYLLGLRPTAPDIAISELNTAIDVELQRWKEMFASVSPGTQG